jgi:hypothetical protein
MQTFRFLGDLTSDVSHPAPSPEHNHAHGPRSDHSERRRSPSRRRGRFHRTAGFRDRAGAWALLRDLPHIPGDASERRDRDLRRLESRRTGRSLPWCDHSCRLPACCRSIRVREVPGARRQLPAADHGSTGRANDTCPGRFRAKGRSRPWRCWRGGGRGTGGSSRASSCDRQGGRRDRLVARFRKSRCATAWCAIVSSISARVLTSRFRQWACRHPSGSGRAQR